jgi:hypothetical protein
MAGDAAVLVEFDEATKGATLLALSDKRNQLIKDGKPTDAVNEAIVKIAHGTLKKRRDCREGR